MSKKKITFTNYLFAVILYCAIASYVVIGFMYTFDPRLWGEQELVVLSFSAGFGVLFSCMFWPIMKKRLEKKGL